MGQAVSYREASRTRTPKDVGTYQRGNELPVELRPRPHYVAVVETAGLIMGYGFVCCWVLSVLILLWICVVSSLLYFLATIQ